MNELIPEQNHDLENIVIGSILMDKNVLDIVFTNLRTEDFELNANKAIFNSCLRLYTDAKPVDMVTVFQDMKANKEPDQTPHIMTCTNKVVSTANVEYHVLLLRNKAVKRQLEFFGMVLNFEARKDEITAADLVSKTLTGLDAIRNRIAPKKMQTFKETVVKTIDEALSNDGQPLGIKTGFEIIDDVMGGLCAPDYTIIAARPGIGKSTFALNISKNIALSGEDVLYFSLEMLERQLIWKLLSDELDKTVYDVRVGNFDPTHAFKTRLTEARLHVYDKGGITIDEISAICNMEKKTKNIKLVVIDYVQLVSVGMSPQKLNTRNDTVAYMSNKIKQLCMNLDLPFLVLSQLSRDMNLRDSGALEQDADNVIYLDRPIENGLKEYSMGGKIIDVTEETAIGDIKKCRLGRTGQIEMIFKGKFSRFENLQPESYEKTNFISNFVEPKMPKIDLNEDLPF